MITILSANALPLIYTIVGFGSLITVHEFGHFLFCKLFGIHTPTFSIGFGPEIIRRKIGATDFRLALLPFGGYVEIAGHGEVGQGEQLHAQLTGENSFASKPYWQKALVLLGGIIFNILFAYITFAGLFYRGSGNQHEGIRIGTIIAESPAASSGLEKNDLILSINEKSLFRDNQMAPYAQELLLAEIRNNPNKDIALKINRDGVIIEKIITLGARHDGSTNLGVLGANFNIPLIASSLTDALIKGAQETMRWISIIASNIKSLVGRRSLEGAGGPVMIMAQSFSLVQTGFAPFFIFLAIISINLALINLLPFGIVDGGQLLFISIEAIIRRPIPDIIKMAINIISFGIIIASFVYLTYKDISLLLGSKIQSAINWITGLINK